MKKYGPILLFLFALTGLFLYAQPAHAVLGVFDFSITDIPSMALDALDFVDGLIEKIFVWFILLTGVTAVFLLISALLLQWASTLPVGLDNTLVNAGWSFTTGLVNMVFILILVTIAFALILNKDAFGYKKALPRLIGVALLVNFSLLFVKIFVDIGWVVQNSFKESLLGGNIIKLAIEPLRSELMDILKLAVTRLLIYVGVAVIPGLNVAKAIWLATAMISEAFAGTFSQALLFIIFGLVSSIIFLIYTIFFLVRIAVIWLLAIAAPLAFVAYIFPQTKKYFDQWFHALVSWTFIGVVMFFLMGLGLRLFAISAPVGGGIRGISGGWNFLEDYSKFIFLLVYLVVTLIAVKKFMPAGMNAVWSYGEMAIKGGGKLAAGAVARWGGRMAAGLEGRKRGAAERLETKLEAGKQPTMIDKIRFGLGLWRNRPEKIKERVGEIKELAEAREKMLREQVRAGQRAQITAKLPKDPEARKAYIDNALLKEGTKPVVLRDKNKMDLLVEVAVKEGKITPAVAKFVGEAVQRKVVKEEDLYAKRPDLALNVTQTTDPEKIKKLISDGVKAGLAQDMAEIKAKEQIIKEGMDKVTSEDFRKNIQKEALQNDAVVLNLLKDEGKFQEMWRNGKPEQRTIIIDTLNASGYPMSTPEELELSKRRIDQMSRTPGRRRRR